MLYITKEITLSIPKHVTKTDDLECRGDRMDWSLAVANPSGSR